MNIDVPSLNNISLEEGGISDGAGLVYLNVFSWAYDGQTFINLAEYFPDMTTV